MKIQYDTKEYKEEIYRLWQEAFHDSKAFADYYFQQVYADNQVLIAREDKEVLSMIHLNPYEWKWNNRTSLQLHYIVGVATKKSHRRQGYMASCMKQVLQDMAEQKEPFTYLMPANPDYYTPFQFQMWKEERRRHINPQEKSEISRAEMPIWRYSKYPVRNQQYLNRLLKEMQSEQGGIIRDESGAYAAYGVEEAEGIQKILIQQVFFENAEEKSPSCEWQYSFWKRMIEQLQKQYPDYWIEWMESQPMMIRILNLEKFIGLLSYSGSSKQLQLHVTDDFCRNNEGNVEITLSEEGCHLRWLSDEKCSLPNRNIGELTELLLRETHLGEQVYLMEIV